MYKRVTIVQASLQYSYYNVGVYLENKLRGESKNGS